MITVTLEFSCQGSGLFAWLRCNRYYTIQGERLLTDDVANVTRSLNKSFHRDQFYQIIIIVQENILLSDLILNDVHVFT